MCGVSNKPWWTLRLINNKKAKHEQNDELVRCSCLHVTPQQQNTILLSVDMFQGPMSGSAYLKCLSVLLACYTEMTRQELVPLPWQFRPKCCRRMVSIEIIGWRNQADYQVIEQS